jgi:hypothetical protein
MSAASAVLGSASCSIFSLIRLISSKNTILKLFRVIRIYLIFHSFQTSIFNGFLQIGICPKVLVNGRIIKFLEVYEFNLQFILSNDYLPFDEYDLKELYNLPMVNIFFPQNFFIATVL